MRGEAVGSSLAHNPEVAGLNPALTTKIKVMKKLLLLSLLSLTNFVSFSQPQMSSSWIEVEKSNTSPNDTLIVNVFHRYPLYQDFYTNWQPPIVVAIEIYEHIDTLGWRIYGGNFSSYVAVKIGDMLDTTDTQNGNVFIKWSISKTHIYRLKVPILNNNKTKFRILSRSPVGSNTYVENANSAYFSPSSLTDYVYFNTNNLNINTINLGNFPIYIKEKTDTNTQISNVFISDTSDVFVSLDTMRWFFGYNTGRLFIVNNYIPINQIGSFNLNFNLNNSFLNVEVSNSLFGYPNQFGQPYRIGYAFNIVKSITPTDSNVTHIWSILNVIPIGVSLSKEDLLRERKVKWVDIFNILGQKIYTGDEFDFVADKNNIYIFIYYLDDGFIRKEKKIFTNF